jgi:hypothetical protein
MIGTDTKKEVLSLIFTDSRDDSAAMNNTKGFFGLSGASSNGGSETKGIKAAETKSQRAISSAGGDGSTNSTKGKEEEEDEGAFDLSFDEEFLFLEMQRDEIEEEGN